MVTTETTIDVCAKLAREDRFKKLIKACVRRKARIVPIPCESKETPVQNMAQSILKRL